jgi:hypothetical protein
LGAGTLDLGSLLAATTICLTVFWLGVRFVARAEVALPLIRVA